MTSYLVTIGDTCAEHDSFDAACGYARNELMLGRRPVVIEHGSELYVMDTHGDVVRAECKPTNLDAETLISAAKARCPSCRTHWRIRVGTFVHTNGAICSAQDERQALRALASRGKDDAILERQIKQHGG